MSSAKIVHSGLTGRISETIGSDGRLFRKEVSQTYSQLFISTGGPTFAIQEEKIV
jgi:hypothetical protein